jgi:uncharacterized protein (TIGR02996 family)
MTERDALLRAVCENPDDDLPRLVLADWLDEHDEPERAEFIRCAVELARLRDAGTVTPTGLRTNPKSDPATMARRYNDIKDQNYRRWLAELPTTRGITNWELSTFRRGFAEGVIVQQGKVDPKDLEPLFQAAPIEYLWLRKVRNIKGLANYARLGQIKTLTVESSGVKAELITSLIDNPHLATLRRLEIRGYPFPVPNHLRTPLKERFGPSLGL